MKNKIVKFIGYSGSGKTTLIEKIVKRLSSEGIKVATVKHDVHGLDIDKEGKDSYRYSKAGANVSIVSSPDMTVFKYHKKLSLNDIISKIDNVDLIIVEGYSSEDNIPTICVGRLGTGKGFKGINTDGSFDKNIIAIVSDYAEKDVNDIIKLSVKFNDNLKHFNINDDIEELIDFIKSLDS